MSGEAAAEALAREAYRRLFPGAVNLPDGQRSSETDAIEQDDAYRIWDGGREGYSHGLTCRRLGDALLAAIERGDIPGVTLAETVIDAIEETFLGQLPSKALTYCAQEDVNAGLDAMCERFGVTL